MILKNADDALGGRPVAGARRRPAPEPWMPMPAIVSLADEDGGTRYVATARHRDAASRER